MQTMEDGMRVFLGTGLIGGSLAQAAAQRGDAVRVWNRTRSKAEELAAHGCEVAVEPAQAVEGATIVHLAMPADAQVDELLARITPHLGPDTVVVDHSTTSPEGAARRVAAMDERGVGFLHAPVFMSPAACLAGSGVMVVCGPKPAFEQVEPALEAMTGTLLYVGQDGHRAAALKLAGNGMILSVIGGLADVMAMADAQGVSADDVMSLFEHFDLRASLRGRGARMAQRDWSVSWTLRMARKDQGLMVDAARGRPLPVLQAVGSRMDQLIGEGEGEQDLAILARDAHRE